MPERPRDESIRPTPRDVVERALRESEERYRSLFEESIDIIYITSRDGRLVDISPSAVSLFGYTREELIERDVHGLYADPEQRVRFQEAIERDGFVRGFEIGLLNKDGQLVNCLLTSTIRKSSDGATLGYQGIIRNITERKKAESARERERAAFRVLAEAAVRAKDTPDLCRRILKGLVEVLKFDGGTIRLFNSKEGLLEPAAVIGVPRSDLRRITDISVAEDRECVTSHVARTGRPIFAPDLTRHDISRSHSDRIDTFGLRSLVASPVFAASGELLAVILLFGRDTHKMNEEEDRVFFETVAGLLGAVLERRLSEEEKQAVEAQLVRSQKMEAVGTLASGVAHDFNNLLTAIQGFTELALMSTDPEDRLHNDLEKIRTAADRGAGLVRQLLLFGRDQQMQMGPIDVNATAVGMVKMLSPLIGEDVTIETELEFDPWLAHADEGSIQQVLMNLAINARDAMPEGGTLRIATKNVSVEDGETSLAPEAKPGAYVCVSVQDSGAGMDEETIDRIFEPFFSTKGPGKGTGLGLSVVYGIVTQHGGWITARSTPRRGTTFDVYLPAAGDVGVPDQSSRWVQHEPGLGSGERILVVEDEQSVRDLACTVLRKHGYEVFEAGNCEQAMDIYRREEGVFDLVFSDVVLPDRSGVQLADELLSERPTVRLLLSSGHADNRSQWDTINERGIPFIRKPYSLPNLLKMVRDAMAD
jgi:PAS domain S-box-containing protein